MELFAVTAKHAAAPDRRLGPPALWWRRHARRAAPSRPGEYAGAAQPAVLAIEDLHRADPTILDLLRGIAGHGALAPLFIVATTRPEFRPPWVMRSHHATIASLIRFLGKPEPIQITHWNEDAGRALP